MKLCSADRYILIHQKKSRPSSLLNLPAIQFFRFFAPEFLKHSDNVDNDLLLSLSSSCVLRLLYRVCFDFFKHSDNIVNHCCALFCGKSDVLSHCEHLSFFWHVLHAVPLCRHINKHISQHQITSSEPLQNHIFPLVCLHNSDIQADF